MIVTDPNAKCQTLLDDAYSLAFLTGDTDDP